MSSFGLRFRAGTAALAAVLFVLGGVGNAAAAVPSTLAGKAMGRGATVLNAQLGWPGISATLLHGMNERADVGGRLSFNYGFEGLTQVVPGIKLQSVFRIELVDKATYNLGIVLDPGFFFYFPDGGRYWYGFRRGSPTMFGMTIPAHLVFGLPVNKHMMVNLGVDMPVSFAFNYGVFVVPVLFGGGFEYELDPRLAVSLNTRFGPAITSGGYAYFCLSFLFGLAFRL